MGRQRRVSVSPEEKALIASRARRRFKALGRLAFAFRFWLGRIEGSLSDNVARNIKLLTQRRARKGQLTLDQKRIMLKPQEDRTPDERKQLQRTLGGLKCFRRYPTEVKIKLAEVSYFRYYENNRVVVRENDEAHALYFILVGRVAVSTMEYDVVLNETRVTVIRTMEAGSLFGEVSLLHGVRRAATITTADHCELLMLKKDDFETVLKATVMAEWDDIKASMGLFDYFEKWDPISIRDCCILSKIKRYETDDIVLSDDIGEKKYVYFIVEGRVHLIEHLDLELTKIGCKMGYKLLTEEEAKGRRHSLQSGEFDLDKFMTTAESRYRSETSFTSKHDAKSKTSIRSKSSKAQFSGSQLKTILSEDESRRRKRSSQLSRMTNMSKISEESLGQQRKVSSKTSQKSGKSSSSSPQKNDNELAEEKPVVTEADPAITQDNNSAETAPAPKKSSLKHSSQPIVVQEQPAVPEDAPEAPEGNENAPPNEPSSRKSSLKIKSQPEISGGRISSKQRISQKAVVDDEAKKRRHSGCFTEEEWGNRMQRRCSDSARIETTRRRASDSSRIELPPKVMVRVETHFIRIGIMNRLSTFNIGESFHNRFVLCVERAKILLIPRYWLVQKNRDIWNSIKTFLNQRLPTRESIFSEFIQQKKWLSYRKKVTEDILVNCKKVNPNTIHNVPYSIRMNEDIDYCVCPRITYV